MEGLDTTNLLLGIMAAVSVAELIGLLLAGIMGYRLYGHLTRTIQDLERRQLAPLSAQVQSILGDLKDVTNRVRDDAARVDGAVRDTITRVDETAEVLRARMRSRTAQALAIVSGIRTTIETVLAGTPGRPRRERVEPTEPAW